MHKQPIQVLWQQLQPHQRCQPLPEEKLKVSLPPPQAMDFLFLGGPIGKGVTSLAPSLPLLADFMGSHQGKEPEVCLPPIHPEDDPWGGLYG